MKIFMTGGTGFNGSYLLNELQDQNDEILVLTRNKKYKPKQKNIVPLYGNLSNVCEFRDEIRKFSPDVAVHLAWEGIPYDYGPLISAKNLRNSLDLIVSLSEIGCMKIISTGTCWEYGVEEGKVDEFIEPRPSKPIAIAKNSFYKITNEIAKEKGINFIWTRLFYVYGPGRYKSTLIPSIAECIFKGKKLDIKTPRNSFDFIYVEDVANAISKIIRMANSSMVYNIGSGRSVSINDIVKMIYEEAGKDFNEEDFQFQDSKIVNFWADISKIKRDLDWEPKINIQDGISKTISELRK